MYSPAISYERTERGLIQTIHGGSVAEHGAAAAREVARPRSQVTGKRRSLKQCILSFASKLRF